MEKPSNNESLSAPNENINQSFVDDQYFNQTIAQNCISEIFKREDNNFFSTKLRISEIFQHLYDLNKSKNLYSTICGKFFGILNQAPVSLKTFYEFDKFRKIV